MPIDPPRRGSIHDAPSSRTPFGPLRRLLPLIAVLGLTAVVFAIGGGRLWGGRWLSVHAFTLGPLTVAVVAFSVQLGAGFTSATPPPPRVLLVLAGAGVLVATVPQALSGARPAWARAGVGVGATVVTAGVMVGYVRLRRLRKGNPQARWAWVVRIYERAHGAFAHGALLGALVGAGVLEGRWWLAARHAHLHVLLLGFAGMTLLATLVVFGPALLRARLAPGADDRAQPAIRLAVSGVTVMSVGLLLSAVDGGVGTAFRLVGAAGAATFAWAATVVARDVLRSASGRTDRVRERVLADHVIAVAWLLAVVPWLDVLVIATGEWRWLDAVGALGLVGILAQVVVSVVVFAGTQVRGRTIGERRHLADRLDVMHPYSVVAVAAGALAIAAATSPGSPAPWRDALGRVGVALLCGTLAVLAGLVLGPRRESSPPPMP